MPVPKIIAKITISVIKTGETPLKLFYKIGYRNSFQLDIVLDKSRRKIEIMYAHKISR